MKKAKKVLSLVLVVLMLVSIMPMAFAEGSTYEVGDIIQFGSYPQSEVTDETLIAQLNVLAPEWEEWTSYGYYSGNGAPNSQVKGDWMRYIDICYEGEKYRGVKFTQYRPKSTYLTHSNGNSNVYYGHYPNTTFWFIFQPVEWEVLNPKTGLVASRYILDAQAFRNTTYRSGKPTDGTHYGDPLCSTWATDYEVSDIRQWLNHNFYEDTFNNEEKINIKYTTIDDNIYQEKVFLLSIQDITNSATDDMFAWHHTFRFFNSGSTSYAKVQGLYVSGTTSPWLLRSSVASNDVLFVSDGGDCYYREHKAFVSECDKGIRPALYLKMVADAYKCPHKTTTEYGEVMETCTNDGYTSGIFCDDCNEWIYGHEVIIASGHNYIETVKEATCAENGYNLHTCSKCLVSYKTNHINATGHSYIEHIIYPTCVSSGYTLYICSNCSSGYSSNFTEASGHSFTNYTSNNDATCSVNGTKTAKCNNCDITDTKTDFGSAVGHTYTAIDTKPTCITQGYTTYTCDCGDSYISDKIDVVGHSYRTVIIKPTCTATGYTIYTCYCGDNYIADLADIVKHQDNNGDYKCDYGCGYEFEKPINPTPDNSDCSCMCHKAGIMRIIWMILKFIYKIFGMNSTCACGIAHY